MARTVKEIEERISKLELDLEFERRQKAEAARKEADRKRLIERGRKEIEKSGGTTAGYHSDTVAQFGAIWEALDKKQDKPKPVETYFYSSGFYNGFNGLGGLNTQKAYFG